MAMKILARVKRGLTGSFASTKWRFEKSYWPCLPAIDSILHKAILA
jgi:hypothetical protein